MLLKRLIALAERENLLGEIPKNHAWRPVNWFAEINLDGTWRGNGFVPQDKKFEKLVPFRGRSGKNPPPFLLYDTAATALGYREVKEEQAQENRQHVAFIELLKECAEKTGNPYVIAVIQALQAQDRPPFPSEMKERQWITFRVDDVLVIEQPDVREFWMSYSDEKPEKKSKKQGVSRFTCIGCGEKCEPLKVHTIDIVLPAGDRSRGKLISANENAYLSYGLEKSHIAPTCATCDEKYGKALVYLLSQKPEPTYMTFGNLVYIFWTKQKQEFSFFLLINQADSGAIESLFQSVKSGNRTEVETNEFYCAALSPNKARIVVRDWTETTLSNVQQNIVRFFKRQQLRDRYEEKYYGIYALAAALYRNEKEMREKMIPSVPLVLLQHALHGKPLPRVILHQVVQRCRAEGEVTRTRAALLKLILLQDTKFEEEDLMEVDVTLEHPAYVCGRLFAVLESIQQQAVSPNATITDRYYGTASTAPASVFAYLLRNAQNHLGKLRKNKPGMYVNLSKELEEIMSKLPRTFPAILTPDQQGMFALGFYHQKAAAFAKYKKKEEDVTV